jgi:hypothetical protein
VSWDPLRSLSETWVGSKLDVLAGGTLCRSKTMMSKQVCQTQTWAHIMCRLGRALRSRDEDEGRGEEGGGGRRQRTKHGGGMKNRVDKSREIETRITEAFAKVRTTDPFVCVCMFTPRHKFQWSIKF